MTFAIVWTFTIAWALALDPVDELQASIVVQLSQKLLNSLGQMLAELIQITLLNLRFPDLETEKMNITNVTFTKLDWLNVQLILKQSKGINALLEMGVGELNGLYEFDLGLFSSQGRVRLLLVNLTMNAMLTKITPTTLTIGSCSSRLQDVRLFFSDKSWYGSLLNSARFAIEAVMVANFGKLACDIAINATHYTRTYFDNTNTAIASDMLKSTCGNSAPAESWHNVWQMSGKVSNKFQLHVHLSDIGVQCGHHGLLIPFQVEVSYAGETVSTNHGRPIRISSDRQMVNVYASEQIVNAFFEHIHRHQLDKYEITINSKILPSSLRTPFTLLCWGCELLMLANFERPPDYIITADGSVLDLMVLIQLRLSNILKRDKLLEARSNIRVGVKYSLDQSMRLQTEITLQQVNVRILKMPVKRVFGPMLQQFLENQVRGNLWNLMLNQYKQFADLNQIQLKPYCEMEFQNASLMTVDNAVLLSTDIVFDHSIWIAKLKRLFNI
ncbi:Nose resistant to fluoxetine protein 5 [Trichinella nativa]|uniref:Nose resistant to fluoxetine protein 5 n=1 Tax=Trichinella nativa TaxID=6335 RepID=A0A0V1KP19_9BILA|nr:Nose resistant to fluoxetine protein 5 [Trichinella sp. T6]KRZ48802.1 Nose resistant to fluoxetine protein 5 [Trichinella nativa]